MAFDPRQPRPRPQREQPRRVVGGVKLLKLEPDERDWAAQRWLRLLDDIAEGEVVRTGLEYAQLGQTRSVEILPGVVEALVQGRRPRAYQVELRLPPIPPAGWDRIADAIIEDSSLAAPLLTGQLPRHIEDVFPAADATLFPPDVKSIHPSCTCGVAEGTWCKHAVCAARVVSDALHRDPLLIFRLRGQDADDLLERLRRRRAAHGSVLGVSPAYAPRINLPPESIPSGLEESLESFWTGDVAAAERIDTSPRRATPSHALLRRLGPSTFQEARFPLVGLLASCYDEIAESVWRGIRGESAEGTNADEIAPSD